METKITITSAHYKLIVLLLCTAQKVVEIYNNLPNIYVKPAKKTNRVMAIYKLL